MHISMLRLKYLLSFIVVFFVLLSPTLSYAINLGFDKTGVAAVKAGYDPATGETSFAGTVGIVVKAAISMVGVIFLALMVYAGYLWMTARGEEEPITKAQKIITACIIGLIIVAGAYSFTAFVVPQILKKTTGKAGGTPVPKTGAPKVDCCSFCDTWETGKCPPPQQMGESACTSTGGQYLGLKLVDECK